MKYLSTTANKVFTFLAFLLLTISSIQAQKNTDSPYSRYGVGLLNPLRFNGNFGLSGTGVAWRPSQYRPAIYDSLARSNAKLNDRGTNYINPVNPASFSNISLTTFEAALVSRNVAYKSGDQSRNGSNTQLSHMAVAIPLAKKFGLGFGIRPYSFVGYNYSTSGVQNGNELNFVNEGSGGINEIFLGGAYQLMQNFSLGISGKYYFGKIIDDRRVVYTGNSTNFFNTLDQRDTRVSSLVYEIGLQYFKNLNKDYRIIAGAVISPINELQADQSRLMRNYTGSSNLENFRDTAIFFQDKGTTVPIAPVYGLGFAFEKKLSWMLMADIKLNAWDGELLAEGIERNSSQVYSLGFDRYVNTSAFGSYFKRMGYRAGISYNTSLLTIDNTDVTEFGISFGIAMPLRKSFSTLNVGVEFGQRGKDESGLTQENFVNLQFGVTINDKWFIQRKYD